MDGSAGPVKLIKKNKITTVEQSLISGYTIEKQYMYRQTICRMFVDFGKASVTTGFTT